jgi:hypothetical protein
MNNPQNEEQTINKDTKIELPKNNLHHSEKKDKEKEESRKYKLSENEYALLKIAEYEYNDLFPEILKNNKANFFSSLQRYILINLSPKNIIFPNGTLDKILKIIEINYYNNDYSRILNLINYVNKTNTYLTFNGHNFLTHCTKTRKAMHSCGNKFLILDNGRYLLCKNCNLIYHHSNVLLLCDFCNKEYFTEIKEINSIQRYCIENNLKPATWVKYHCNAIMNDTMKCQNCSNILYLNKKNKLICLNCNIEIDQFDIKWKCMICSKEFTSEAKEYDPFIFKIIKITVKQTLFKGIEAKPPYVPCCKISNEQINIYKFFHKKECNGLLYEGEMDNKKIVVCSKCHMLNYYYNHYWLCPICKKRYKLKEFINNNNNEYSKTSNNNNSISEKNNNSHSNINIDSIDNNNRMKQKSIKEFSKKESLIEELSPELKSSSISIFPKKGREKHIQASLINKFGLQKLASKEDIANVYKTNDTKNAEDEEININIDDRNIGRKYSKSVYYSNKNIKKNINNKNLLYQKSNNNENNNNNYNEENNTDNNNYIKINKEYDNEIVVHSISPIKQMIKKKEKDKELKEIKVNKNNIDFISNDNKINLRGSSFKRISSFCVKGSDRGNRILSGNNNYKKELIKFYNDIEQENEYKTGGDEYNEKKIKSKLFIDEYKNINNNYNEKYKYIDEGNNKKIIEGNITAPFNLGKGNQLVSNNIHINVNLNLNINNNNNHIDNINTNSNYNNMEYFAPSPKKIRPRINSAKDISSKRKFIQKTSSNFYKKNSMDIVTNNFNINDYNIIKQIGEGTFGKIFEVEDSNHYHFALKKLLANSIKEMEMLKSEYELLLGLEGLNINLIHIYGIENKKLDKTTFVVYVLMELAICDWEKEISNREKKKRYYSEEELIIILKNLIFTFAELQRHNISHRDIKPQNILLCSDNNLKIADFGEAKEARNRNNIDTIRQTIRGTELYMSPILFDSLKTKKRNGKYILHNSYKSDVFSLGFCILLAATLKVDSLYVIREIKDMNILQKEVYNFLKNRYSNKLINVIISMLEIEEKNRVDFIELEKIVENL